jgi:hypothetical protein
MEICIECLTLATRSTYSTGGESYILIWMSGLYHSISCCAIYGVHLAEVQVLTPI